MGEITKIAGQAETDLHMANELIMFARDVLGAHELLKDMPHAPNLVPVAQYLLTQAQCKHLHEMQNALQDEFNRQAFPLQDK